MSSYSFGAGTLWGTPLTDAFGNAIANPTPYLLGVLQDFNFDESSDVKMLYGQNAYPVAVGRGKQKISCKARFARMNVGLVNALFIGQPLQVGATGLLDTFDTTGKLIPATPFQLTVTSGAVTLTNIQMPGTGPVFVADLGVTNSNGVPLIRVASAPTTGQYSLSGSTYTFAAADVGTTIFLCYQYTVTSPGSTLTVQNIPMGYAPIWQADYQCIYNGKPLVRSFPQCIATKWNFASKLDDFAVPELDFECFGSGANTVSKFSMSE